MIQREHSLQAWVDRFIDRVVLPPMFTSAIEVAARDMANVGRRSALQARGLKFGLPDLFVCQPSSGVTLDRTLGRTLWIELKAGTRLSAGQAGVHEAMRLAGQYVEVCSSVHEVLNALRSANFKLHLNADNLAAEYQMRVVASETAPRTPRKPRAAPKVKYGRRTA